MASSILLRNATVLIHDEEDHVTPHANTDILITNDIIADVGRQLSAPENARVIECTGKIITPGFIDTHHHLWQMQLKGRFADDQLLDYLAAGNIQNRNYTPPDLHWGQLSGCLEALDAGTTTVCDHSHSSYTPAHADAVLAATIASGLRTVLAFSPIATIGTWNETECVASGEMTLDWTVEYIEKLLQRPDAPDGIQGRVYAGFGFDFFFLPKDLVVSIFTRLRNAGVKLITAHVSRDLILGKASTTHLLHEYGLLGPDILFSHATGIDDSEKKVLFEKGVYVSSTPETECQMALGYPLALDENVHGSLGVDCHANNSSSIMAQARTLLQVIRTRDFAERNGETYPRKVLGSSEQVFNLATVEGARAMGMGDSIGRVKRGMKADLVVWEWEGSVGMLGCGDALVAVVRHSDLRDVNTVIVGGRVVKEEGKLSSVAVDGKVAGMGEGNKEMHWKDVASEVMRSRAELYERMDKCSLVKAREMLVGMFHIDDTKLV